jgi:protein-S-isoprenylcysteine O-methyltransferase Ste14
MPKVILRLIADAILVAAILLSIAGNFVWLRAWVLVVVLFVVRFVSAVITYRVNPALLRDRAGSPLHADQPVTDKILVIAVLGTGFLGIPAIAAFDSFHWHIFQAPPAPLSAAGLLLFTAGWGIKGAALRSNAFATAALRLQHERKHVVVDNGPYAVIRHPFYAADPLILLGLSLWLQSYTAALCSIIPITIMLLRLSREERFLLSGLPGYREYVERVRHRIIPGLW